MKPRPESPSFHDIAETSLEEQWFEAKPREFVDPEREAQKKAKEAVEGAGARSGAVQALMKGIRSRPRLAQSLLLAINLTNFASAGMGTYLPRRATPEGSISIDEAIVWSEASRIGEDLPSREDMLEHLRKVYGPEFWPQLTLEEAEPRDWSGESVAEASPEFENFGIPSHEFQGYLERGFPRFMTSRSTVREIVYRDESRLVQEEYGLGGGAHALADCTWSTGRSASTINVYRDSFDGEIVAEDREAFLRRTLPHELAHAVDWRNMADIDPAQRVDLLYRVTRLAEDEEVMLHFGYAEHIHNEDERRELRSRSTEYFADLVSYVFQHASIRGETRSQTIRAIASVLCAHYAERPERMRDALPQDPEVVAWERAIRGRTEEAVQLVFDYIQAVDPDFDMHAAHAAREEIVARMRAEEGERSIERAFEIINDDEMSGIFQELRGEAENPMTVVFERLLLRQRDKLPSGRIDAFLRAHGNELDDARLRRLTQLRTEAARFEQDVMDAYNEHGSRVVLPVERRSGVNNEHIVAMFVVMVGLRNGEYRDVGPGVLLQAATRLKGQLAAATPEEREALLHSARLRVQESQGEFFPQPLADRYARLERQLGRLGD